jgi:hypothetical protein
MKTKLTTLIYLLTTTLFVGYSQTTIIPMNAPWKYLDNGTNQGDTWRNNSYNDALWNTGNAELGYGDGGEATVLSYGTNSSAKYITTYFRKTINLTNPSLFTNISLNIRRDDGVVVYINGNEVYRNNMPAGIISNTTLASTACSDDGNTTLTTTLASTAFTSGNNTIAVEIHQNAASSSDISFNLSLIGNTGAATSLIKHIRWGSYGDPLNGLTVTWRNIGSADQIKWGYTTNYEQGTFSATQRSGYADNFFKYTFPSVTPNVTIYYQLYDSQSNAWSSGKSYATAPPVNTTDFSFLAIGDSRSGLNIWNQVSNLANTKNTDFAVFNGDIVNNGGSATDWNNWFDYGQDFIEKNLVYHAMGNHDASSVPTYQNVFELPKSTPINGTNLYYSFTYGDAVIISLNSEDPNNTAQYNWLINTLQANSTKKWKIIFFHRPFYTIGNHAGEMNSYFNTWWKAFDDYGVDLILNGHDHMYERTKPINRNISTSSTVTEYGSLPTQGRCQIVCGGAGAPLYSGNSSWFIESFQSIYNFCKLDVTANSLCNTAYDNNGNIIDSFCINKSNLSTNENIKFFPLTLSPNPVNDVFNLKYNSPILGSGFVRIIDLTGKILSTNTIHKTENEFNYSHNVSKLAKGVYNVVITIENQSDTSLLIVN